MSDERVEGPEGTADLPDEGSVQDGASAAEVRAVIERLIPDAAQRQAVLGLLADSIIAAEQGAPGRWGLPLYQDRIWFVVGPVVVLDWRRGRLGLTLDRHRVPDLEALERDGVIQGQYKSLPASTFLGATIPDELELVRRLWPAHEAILVEAGRKVRRVREPTMRAHSPGFLAYLRETLGRDVPDASFDRGQASPATGSNVWIFQANPQHYALRDELPRLGVGTIDRWAVSAYERRLQPGDTVLLWQSGKQAGVYGRGVLTEPPFERDWEPDPALVERQPYQRSKWWVRYRLTDIYPEHLPRDVLMSDPVLGQMDLFRNSRGSTFRVSPEEWARLGPMLEGAGSSQLGGAVLHDLNQLRAHLAAEGLAFTPLQIATYVTALQAKGFVILSGISGTGKTKLAQGFARLLPQPMIQAAAQAATEGVAITLKPYMFRYNRLIVPKQMTRLFDPPAPGETKEVLLQFAGKQQPCRLTHAVYSDTDYIALMLRGSARAWFQQTFQPDDTMVLDPQFDADQNLTGFRLIDPTAAAAQPDTERPNWLFVPVRPDWRDSKSILGYFNPLAGEYVWTDFLRFLVAAEKSYRAGEGVAWFVILDEMNLARVEYYFADLLSVLESGRDANGQTREPLRLDYPSDAEGDLPPREIHLPPNLFVVGTVNMDETTHAFSPKVLDRAFTIEFTDVDFGSYPPQPIAAPSALGSQQRQELLRAFMLEGDAGHVDKARIAAVVGAYPQVRHHLQTLNGALQPYGMHFGYRVFDEVASFVAAAERNGLFADLEGWAGAFDAAVLMKVLPKFHGSRARLEGPLRAVLSWCLSPAAPDVDPVEQALATIESASAAVQQLGRLTYHYPRTAQRVQRMIYSLYTDGFAAFG